ncbi:uncharacterized protein EI90DRAFT_3066603 [Cantharellus anzutake]|uniref:uncharacterized protein n=1 Tax=Cantharellus anzutake TaxID=1750568 RepID=UPI0019090520|nr:uncharacterized protein EI90DRAFT_3066603 [Cantharellus anzutake]KAF8327705.1 hypothetical protein EI90DRAFT_3066603 [Cantharellus anzutake]
MDASPLPPHPSFQDESVARAYSRCRELEKTLAMEARVLGYLLLLAPEEEGRRYLASEINPDPVDDSGNKTDDSVVRGDETLCLLAKLYIAAFIRCFRSAKGPTPDPSLHPSHISFEGNVVELSYKLMEPPSSHQMAKHKAIRRDGGRCVATGKYDLLTAQSDASSLEFKIPPDAPCCMTEAALIFPSSINRNIAGGNEGAAKNDWAASVWAVMEHFGNVRVLDELNGDNIHRLENVLTLSHDIHSAFDQLKFWFEATNANANEYRLRTLWSRLMVDKDTIVTLTTPDPQCLPLPSPKYLALHAACCKVAHLSGAAEHIDRCFRDLDGMRVLAEDGSNVDVLMFVLEGITV